MFFSIYKFFVRTIKIFILNSLFLKSYIYQIMKKNFLVFFFLIYSFLVVAQVNDSSAIEQKPLKMYTAKSEKGKILTFAGDLSEGVIIHDLSWASKKSVSCFQAKQNDKFNGNHIIYITEIPAHYEMKIEVIPDNKNANFSLWAFIVGKNNDDMVPNLTSCIKCESDYKWDYPQKGEKQDHRRYVKFKASNYSYKVIIGVVGANELTSGKYKLKISLK